MYLSSPSIAKSWAHFLPILQNKISGCFCRQKVNRVSIDDPLAKKRYKNFTICAYTSIHICIYIHMFKLNYYNIFTQSHIFFFLILPCISITDLFVFCYFAFRLVPSYIVLFLDEWYYLSSQPFPSLPHILAIYVRVCSRYL